MAFQRTPVLLLPVLFYTDGVEFLHCRYKPKAERANKPAGRRCLQRMIMGTVGRRWTQYDICTHLTQWCMQTFFCLSGSFGLSSVAPPLLSHHVSRLCFKSHRNEWMFYINDRTALECVLSIASSPLSKCSLITCFLPEIVVRLSCRPQLLVLYFLKINSCSPPVFIRILRALPNVLKRPILKKAVIDGGGGTYYLFVKP